MIFRKLLLPLLLIVSLVDVGCSRKSADVSGDIRRAAAIFVANYDESEKAVVVEQVLLVKDNRLNPLIVKGARLKLTGITWSEQDRYPRRLYILPRGVEISTAGDLFPWLAYTLKGEVILAYRMRLADYTKIVDAYGTNP